MSRPPLVIGVRIPQQPTGYAEVRIPVPVGWTSRTVGAKVDTRSTFLRVWTHLGVDATA